MSLIRTRLRRKKSFIDVHKGMSARRLIWLFVAVLALIWYLSWRF